MTANQQNDLMFALRLLMRPIARFCARHSFHIQDLIEAAKAAFLDVAQEELGAKEPNLSVCKLSAFTGLHRRDVDRIFKNEDLRESGQGLVNRVIGQWQQSRRFCGASGKPRVLKVSDGKDEFKDLVESVTTEVTPGTVRYELERVGAVVPSRDGLKLVSRVYVPRGDVKAGFRMLQADVDDLVSAVEHNLLGQSKELNLHLKTHYDRIPSHHMAEIREWIVREGSALHQKARNYLSRFDLDLNPELPSTERVSRVALATFALLPPSDQTGEDLIGKGRERLTTTAKGRSSKGQGRKRA